MLSTLRHHVAYHHCITISQLCLSPFIKQLLTQLWLLLRLGLTPHVRAQQKTPGVLSRCPCSTCGTPMGQDHLEAYTSFTAYSDLSADPDLSQGCLTLETQQCLQQVDTDRVGHCRGVSSMSIGHLCKAQSLVNCLLHVCHLSHHGICSHWLTQKLMLMTVTGSNITSNTKGSQSWRITRLSLT